MIKREAWQAAWVLCVLLAAGLGLLAFRSPLFHPGRVYDKDDLLVMENESYHNWRSIWNAPGEDSQVFSLGRFSGVKTVNTIHVDESGSLSCSWNVMVESGKFKIVLVDNTTASLVETICEGSAQGSVDERGLAPGEYRVKFVADRATAKGEFAMVANQP